MSIAQDSLNMQRSMKSLRDCGFSPQTVLGHGGFGLVIECTTDDGLPVAIKVIEKQKMAAKALRSRVVNEVEILAQCRCDRIVDSEDFMETDLHVLLVMEVCRGGDVFGLLKRAQLLRRAKAKHGQRAEDTGMNTARGLHPSVAKEILRQLLEALDYLHSRGVLHRDLKLSNVLLRNPVGDAEILQGIERPGTNFPRESAIDVALADFGLATRVTQAMRGLADGDTASSSSGAMASGGTASDGVREHYTVCGTPQYTAPEVTLPSPGSPHTSAVDIFSAGCLLYTMVFGRSPLESGASPSRAAMHSSRVGTDETSFSGMRLQRDFDFCMERLPAHARSLLRSMLSPNPSERPPASVALKHPFFTSKFSLAGTNGKQVKSTYLGAAKARRQGRPPPKQLRNASVSPDPGSRFNAPKRPAAAHGIEVSFIQSPFQLPARETPSAAGAQSGSQFQIIDKVTAPSLPSYKQERQTAATMNRSWCGNLRAGRSAAVHQSARHQLSRDNFSSSSTDAKTQHAVDLDPATRPRAIVRSIPPVADLTVPEFDLDIVIPVAYEPSILLEMAAPSRRTPGHQYVQSRSVVDTCSLGVEDDPAVHPGKAVGASTGFVRSAGSTKLLDVEIADTATSEHVRTSASATMSAAVAIGAQHMLQLSKAVGMDLSDIPDGTVSSLPACLDHTSTDELSRGLDGEGSTVNQRAKAVVVKESGPIVGDLRVADKENPAQQGETTESRIMVACARAAIRWQAEMSLRHSVAHAEMRHNQALDSWRREYREKLAAGKSTTAAAVLQASSGAAASQFRLAASAHHLNTSDDVVEESDDGEDTSDGGGRTIDTSDYIDRSALSGCREIAISRLDRSASRISAANQLPDSPAPRLDRPHWPQYSRARKHNRVPLLSVDVAKMPSADLKTKSTRIRFVPSVGLFVKSRKHRAAVLILPMNQSDTMAGRFAKRFVRFYDCSVKDPDGTRADLREGSAFGSVVSPVELPPLCRRLYRIGSEFARATLGRLISSRRQDRAGSVCIRMSDGPSPTTVLYATLAPHVAAWVVAIPAPRFLNQQDLCQRGGIVDKPYQESEFVRAIVRRPDGYYMKVLAGGNLRGSGRQVKRDSFKAWLAPDGWQQTQSMPDTAGHVTSSPQGPPVEQEHRLEEAPLPVQQFVAAAIALQCDSCASLDTASAPSRRDSSSLECTFLERDIVQKLVGLWGHKSTLSSWQVVGATRESNGDLEFDFQDGLSMKVSPTKRVVEVRPKCCRGRLRGQALVFDVPKPESEGGTQQLPADVLERLRVARAHLAAQQTQGHRESIVFVTAFQAAAEGGAACRPPCAPVP